MNVELEVRVAERTTALTVAHRGVKENEERLRMAMEAAEIAAWGMGPGERPDDLVDRARNALRVSGRIVRRGPPRPARSILKIASASRQPSRRRRAPARPTSASIESFVPMG